jgi:hypothetical protein
MSGLCYNARPMVVMDSKDGRYFLEKRPEFHMIDCLICDKSEGEWWGRSPPDHCIHPNFVRPSVTYEMIARGM